MTTVLCDSTTVNSYGFRTDVDGIDLSRFAKNPVMLYNHDPEKVIGRWENVQVVESLTAHTLLTATPVFDTDDPFAAEIARKVGDGFIKGCSMGIVVKKMTKTKGIDTATESVLLEASIVSIPADENALVVYEDENKEKTLSINEFNKLYYSMENTEPTPAEIHLSDKNMELQAKIDEQSETIERLNAQIDTLRNELSEREYREAEAFVDSKISGGTIPEKVKGTALSFYLSFPKETEEFLTAIEEAAEERKMSEAPKVSLSAMISRDGKRTESSWEDYDKVPGALQKLKSENFEEFKRLFKERFGTEYNA